MNSKLQMLRIKNSEQPKIDWGFEFENTDVKNSAGT